MLNSNKPNDNDMEESHYYHTLVDFVDLLVTYGFVKVLKDVCLIIEETNE